MNSTQRVEQRKISTAFSAETRQLTGFFILAYLFSWAIAVPLALANHGVIPAVLPRWSHFLAAFGPMLSALTITWRSRGRPGFAELGRQMVKWRACPKWWLIAFSPLIIGAAVIFLLNRLLGSGLALSLFGDTGVLQLPWIVALVLSIVVFGLGAETGWRGFALPRLKKGRGALAATMILALFWAIWYLPQFFYYFDPSQAIIWLMGLFAGAVILTWLYNSTNRSILMAAIWHGSFAFVLVSQWEAAVFAVAMIVLLAAGAVFVIWRYKPKSLMAI